MTCGLKNKMRSLKTNEKIIFLLIVHALFVTPDLFGQNLSKNEVFDVLSKWEGNWKSVVLFEELFG